MTEPFLFSVPSGESVELEPFHYAIIGQTQFSGKTTLIKRLADWIVTEGYKVLIFDTKETEADYTGFGREIPVCLRETTDALILLPLLETVFQRRLPTGYYSVLCDVTAGTKNFEQVIAKAKEKEETSRSGWVRGACRTLYDLLERLQEQLEKVETVPSLELPYEINRMVLNDFPGASQQLFVKNAFEDLLHIYKRKAIGVIDEAFKFIPQHYSSAATKAITTTITQGAKTGLFVWISTQFLAPTNKAPLKACAYKFLGTQDHITEAKHTLDLIPRARGKFSTDDIMSLKLGHWILVRKRPPDVRMVYALPVGVPEKVGRKVALGESSPEFVRDNFLKKMEVNRDLVWKERFENLKREYYTMKTMYDEDLLKLKQLEAEKEELEKKIPKDFDKLVRGYEDEIKRLRKDLTTADALKLEKDKEINTLREDLETFNKLREALGEILLPIKAETMKKLDKILASEPAGPSEVNLEHREMIVKVTHREKPVTLNTDTQKGQIMLCALKDLPREGFTIRSMAEALQERGWNISQQSLAPTISSHLVRDGLLIRIPKSKPKKFRLPTMLRIEVEETYEGEEGD